MRTKKLAKKKAPESIVNDEAKLHATFEPGDVSHQGDLVIVAIRSLPASAKPRSNRQLADGATQGSRHVLERGDVYDASPAEVSELILAATGLRIDQRYVGPVFVSPAQPTANDLSHVEHGNQGFPPKTICAVVYQRSLDQEEREMRVAD